MSIQAKNIRNVVFAGHASKGKTTLCEALLNVAGTTERMGKTADANTVLDFDSEEKKRKISVNSAVASFEYKGKNINLIDTKKGGVKKLSFFHTSFLFSYSHYPQILSIHANNSSRS